MSERTLVMLRVRIALFVLLLLLLRCVIVFCTFFRFYTPLQSPKVISGILRERKSDRFFISFFIEIEIYMRAAFCGFFAIITVVGWLFRLERGARRSTRNF